MTITAIIEASDVRERMSLPDLTDINDAIESYLTSAHLYLQSILETPFEEKDSRVDTFIVNSLTRRDPNGHMVLRLKQAFVQEDTVFISVAENKDATPVDVKDFMPDYEKGLILLDYTVVDGNYVRVYYSAGVTPKTAPDWLKEAALTFVSKSLGSHQGNGNEEAEKVKAVMKPAHINDLVGKMVEPYLRGRAFQNWPTYATSS